MKNWRTTTAAAVTAFFGFVLFSPETFAHFPWLLALAKYGFAGGLASFGIAAKDSAGDKPQG
jgi:hypothetical protein